MYGKDIGTERISAHYYDIVCPNCAFNTLNNIYFVYTALNKFIRPPPKVRFMPQLPQIKSTGNYQNHFFDSVMVNTPTCKSSLPEMIFNDINI